nr:hypothetical protein CFP56_54914 [Quercus suber]
MDIWCSRLIESRAHESGVHDGVRDPAAHVLVARLRNGATCWGYERMLGTLDRRERNPRPQQFALDFYPPSGHSAIVSTSRALVMAQAELQLGKQADVRADAPSSPSSSQVPPTRIKWHRSTYYNALILGLCNFCAPGIWGAMNSLGGGGEESPWLVNAANALIFSLMVLTCALSGVIVKHIGIRLLPLRCRSLLQQPLPDGVVCPVRSRALRSRRRSVLVGRSRDRTYLPRAGKQRPISRTLAYISNRRTGPRRRGKSRTECEEQRRRRGELLGVSGLHCPSGRRPICRTSVDEARESAENRWGRSGVWGASGSKFLDGIRGGMQALGGSTVPPGDSADRASRVRGERVLHLRRPVVQRSSSSVGILPLGYRRHAGWKRLGSVSGHPAYFGAIQDTLGVRDHLDAARSVVDLGNSHRDRVPPDQTAVRLGGRWVRARVRMVSFPGPGVPAELYVFVSRDTYIKRTSCPPL